MTPTEATEAISAAVATGVAAMSGPPQLALGDERFKPTAGTSWIRATVIDGPSPPASHGPAGQRRVQRSGTLVGQCFVAHGADDGVAAAKALAQAFRDLFELTTLSGTGTSPVDINFREADIRPRGIDGGWVQVNVDCPFTYDEIR